MPEHRYRERAFAPFAFSAVKRTLADSVLSISLDNCLRLTVHSTVPLSTLPATGRYGVPGINLPGYSPRLALSSIPRTMNRASVETPPTNCQSYTNGVTSSLMESRLSYALISGEGERARPPTNDFPARYR